MTSLLAASSSNILSIFAAPSLQLILAFVALFTLLNILEKGRWD